MSTNTHGKAEAVALALSCALALASSCEEDLPGPRGATPLPGATPRPPVVDAAAGRGEDPRLVRAQSLLRERRFKEARELLAPAGKPFPDIGTAARDLLDRVDQAELAALARAGKKEEAGRLLERRTPMGREEVLAKNLDPTSVLLDHCLFETIAGPEDRRSRNTPFPTDLPPRARPGATPVLAKLAGTYRLRPDGEGRGHRLELREEGGKLQGAGWSFPFACPAILFDVLVEPGRLLLVHRDVSDSPDGAAGPKGIDELDLDLALDSSGAPSGDYRLARSRPVESDVRENRLDCERGTIARDAEPPAIGCFTQALEERPPWTTLTLEGEAGLPREEWLRRVGQPLGQDVKIGWTVEVPAEPSCPKLPWLGSARVTGVVSKWDLADGGLELDILGSGPTPAPRRCKARFRVLPAPADRLDFSKAPKALLGGQAAPGKNARCESRRCLEMGPYPQLCAERRESAQDAPTLTGRVRTAAGTKALAVRYRFLATARGQARADLVVAVPGAPESRTAIEVGPTGLKRSADRKYRFDSGWKTALVALPPGSAKPAEIGFELRGESRWCRHFIPHGRERNEGEVLLLVQSVAASARK